MILTDWEIKQAIDNGDIVINPFDENLINSNSYNVTLANTFYKVTKPLIDPEIDKEYGEWFEANEYIIKPGEHILGSTNEYIKISNGYVAMLSTRSSFARYGLSSHQNAGFVDSGFYGDLTFEISNENNISSVILRKGNEIGQLIFFKTNKCENPYDIRKKSRYCGQVGATPSATIVRK